MNQSKLLMDAAVIFRVIKKEDSVSFVPNKIVIGTYIKESKTFIDRQGESYYHIIDKPDNYGFACRYSLNNIKKVYPNE